MAKIMTFAKNEVIQLLKSIEQPTPTDKDHEAHWWNEQFGRKIKSNFHMLIQGVVEQIERSKDAF